MRRLIALSFAALAAAAAAQAPQSVYFAKLSWYQQRGITPGDRQAVFQSLQRDMMIQQQNATMMSNMLRMQHETNMAIINNIGTGTAPQYNYYDQSGNFVRQGY